MFKVNKKAILLLIPVISYIVTAQTAETKREPNYESLYKLHLKWDIEDLNKERIKLKIKLDDLQKKRAELLSTMEQLKNEKNLSYHMNTYFKVFQWPRPYRGKSPFGGLDRWTRFLLAWLTSPISAPLMAINARQEWLSKKNNDDQIATLEKNLEENKNVLSIIQPEVEVQIAQIEMKIAELETESETLSHLEQFKKNYKPRYIK